MSTEARLFLESLLAGKPDELFVLLWTLPEKNSRWFRDIESAIQFAESRRDRDLYVGVGLSGRDCGASRRCPSDEVAGILGLWADLDLRSAAHPDKPLPRTTEEALTLLPADLEPTITVATGNGVHVWWIFKEPWIFENDGERKQAAELSSRFQTLLRCNAQARGWAFDRLSDLARVLRIPGTVNAKDPNDRKAVTLLTSSGSHYNPSDFERYLDRLGVPDSAAEEFAQKNWAEQFSADTFVVNPEAAIPEKTLDRWMEDDLRFHDTWLKKRHDLQDQSGSGYDLALACFGARMNLSVQEIVDLIVHHRRKHGKQRRTRVEYYQRTISKAMKGADAAPFESPGAKPLSVPVYGDGVPENGPIPGERMLAPDDRDPAKKAMLCNRISQELGVHLLRLVKVPGKEPVYLMELEEGRIEFDVAKLLCQKAVGLALAAKVGKIIPTFKTLRWRVLTQTMLDACTVVETTDDLQLEGSARIQIDQYLKETTLITSLADAAAQDLYKPLLHNGQIAISSTDLVTHINRVHSQNLSPKSAVAMLAALGAKAERVRGRGFKEQSRWFLPVNEFDPADFAQTYRDEVSRNGE